MTLHPAIPLDGEHAPLALTFDCYGTLIDWESGICRAFEPVLAAAGITPDPATLISRYAAHEREIEAGPYLSYRHVLTAVEARLLNEFLPAGAPRPASGFLASSLSEWPAFDETPPCLRALQSRFRIGVLSNIDDDLFAATAPKLGITLDLLVTAGQVRSYKPAEPHFRAALDRLGIPPRRILHVAESRYHDVESAGTLGFRTCWVNRHSGTAPSASGPADTGRSPDLTVTSLRALVEVLGTPT